MTFLNAIPERLCCDTCGAVKPANECGHWLMVLKVSDARENLVWSVGVRHYCCESHRPDEDPALQHLYETRDARSV